MKKVQLDYGAITIDTCIFENHGLSLEKGLLAQLEQFSSGLVKFILSDVTYNELNNHLIDKNKKSHSIVNQAFKAISNCALIDNNELDNIMRIFNSCEKNDVQHAANRLQNFQKKRLY